MFSTEAFKTWSRDYVMLAHITTRIPGDKHPNLLSEKGGRGFPYMVFLDAEGHLLMKVPSRSLEGIREHAVKAREMHALRKKKAASPDDRIRMLELLAEQSALGLEEARAVIAKIASPDGGQRLHIRRILTDLEVARMLRNTPEKRDDRNRRLGRKFARMNAEGRIPTIRRLADQFYACLVAYAALIEDVVLYEQALSELVQAHGSNKRYARYLERCAKALESLRKSVSAGGGTLALARKHGLDHDVDYLLRQATVDSRAMARLRRILPAGAPERGISAWWAARAAGYVWSSAKDRFVPRKR